IPESVPNHRGPPTILTAYEENEIASYCLNMQQLGFGLTKEAVNTIVIQILST
ncbi:845_t:CDS:2, partial [Gigaspora rosea]